MLCARWGEWLIESGPFFHSKEQIQEVVDCRVFRRPRPSGGITAEGRSHKAARNKIQGSGYGMTLLRAGKRELSHPNERGAGNEVN